MGDSTDSSRAFSFFLEYLMYLFPHCVPHQSLLCHSQQQHQAYGHFPRALCRTCWEQKVDVPVRHITKKILKKSWTFRRNAFLSARGNRSPICLCKPRRRSVRGSRRWPKKAIPTAHRGRMSPCLNSWKQIVAFLKQQAIRQFSTAARE